VRGSRCELRLLPRGLGLCLLRGLLCSLGLLGIAVSKGLSGHRFRLLAACSRHCRCLLLSRRLLCSPGLLHNLGSVSLRCCGFCLLALGCHRSFGCFLGVCGLHSLCGQFSRLGLLYFLGCSGGLRLQLLPFARSTLLRSARLGFTALRGCCKLLLPSCISSLLRLSCGLCCHSFPDLACRFCLGNGCLGLGLLH